MQFEQIEVNLMSTIALTTEKIVKYSIIYIAAFSILDV